MIAKPKETRIAYRCPSCGVTTLGLVGKFALNANMLRLKCTCGESILDINITNDGKIRLSIPCIFCKQNHNFVVSQNIFFERDIFILNCPYANMDICFIGDDEKIQSQLARSEEELNKLLANLELESFNEMQPEDINEEDVLPDATLYDTLRFVLKDLEAEGKVDCPCHNGEYDIRFCDEGVQAYCSKCGATYTFPVKTASLGEEYINLDELILK